MRTVYNIIVSDMKSFMKFSCVDGFFSAVYGASER